MNDLIDTYSSRTDSALLLASLLLVIVVMGSGCGDSFLTPEPKSFVTPENTFTEQSGLDGVLVNMNRIMRDAHYGVLSPLVTEYYYADISALGNPDAHYRRDLVNQLTPTNPGAASVFDYWDTGYNAISHSNMVVSNIDNVEDWGGERARNEVLSSALFHRSFWYYRLINLFGDVPVHLEQINEPRVDFQSFSREAILKQIRDDLEFAVEWLPESARPGEINRAAGNYLLTKVYLQLRQFEDAVDAASRVIGGGQYHLMTERFGQGPYAGDPRFNVIWDLHQKENKSNNDEVILVLQDKFGLSGNRGTHMMYTFVPAYWETQVKDPNGFHAATAGPEGNPLSDSLGRGIAQVRTTDHFNYRIWKEDTTDLRHADINWFSKDEFYYNHPESEYYGEPFVQEALEDTIRTFAPFPYYKVYVPDETTEHRKLGGHTDKYLYRLAGLYLLRAEAYHWLGQNSQAADDINEVRRRAEASPVSPGEVDIDYIFDERARELYAEEPRITELTRVSYLMAQMGEEGYSLENMAQDNWYYDRVMHANKFFREEIQHGPHRFRMRPYHVYWPIPQDEIDSNVDGQIKQNSGYTGGDAGIEPLGYDEIRELRADWRNSE
jgi:hypothetical protein